MFLKNKFLLLILALALSLTMVFGCSDDDDPTDPTDPGGGDPGIEDVGSISGIVLTDGGNAMTGVAVSTGTHNTTTNEEGYFVLAAVPEGSTLVSFTQTGYMSTFRVAEVTSTNSTHYPEVTLVLSDISVFNSTTNALIHASSGSGSVEFGANSFVDGAGQPYTGDVSVQLNALVPDSDDFYGAFPGEYAGIREDGSEVALVSYGIMAVELTSPNKSPLMLADGVTAELNLNISADKVATAPATIPMWYFDESDGQWHEEGEAVLTGSTYTANVAHFTTWNWDVAVTDICSITGVVVDDGGRPVENARVVSRGVDAAIMADAFTAADGTFTVNALKNSLTDVWAISGSRASEGQRVTVLEECPVALAENLVLMVPAYTISLTWGAEPSDLDTHWFIPATWTTDYDTYRIYYSNQGDMGTDPYAALDTDDTSSFGPEIVTGTRLYNGTFEYWVHNYSDDTSSGIQTSGASVQLEVGGNLYQYNAANVTLTDADQTGWWHVFDLNISASGATIGVESVMEFQPEYSGGIIFSGNEGKGFSKNKR